MVKQSLFLFLRALIVGILINISLQKISVLSLEEDTPPHNNPVSFQTNYIINGQHN